MTQSVFRLLLLSLAVLLTGCSGSQRVMYHAELQTVERPDHAQSEHGEYTLSTNETVDGPTSTYEDDMMRATWFFENTSMHLTVENKLPYRIWLLLGDGDFAFQETEPTPLLRGDMGYLEIDPDDTSVPDLLIPSSDPIIEEADPVIESPQSAAVHLLPKRNVDLSSPSIDIKEIIRPAGPNADSAAVHERLGTTFSIRLPIEIRKTVSNYIFHFEVIGAKIPREEEDEVLGIYPGKE